MLNLSRWHWCLWMTLRALAKIESSLPSVDAAVVL
jgi:hypothetical protein